MKKAQKAFKKTFNCLVGHMIKDIDNGFIWSDEFSNVAKICVVGGEAEVGEVFKSVHTKLEEDIDEE